MNNHVGTTTTIDFLSSKKLFITLNIVFLSNVCEIM